MNMINEKQVIESLQTKRRTDPVVDAVCTVFAARQRARDRVSVNALTYRMQKEGFKYSPEDYARVLKYLSQLGLGNLYTDSAGKVRALKDIKITLQSIGLAAVGQTEQFDKDWKRNRFQKIPVVEAAPPAAATPPKKELTYVDRVQPRPAPGSEWKIVCVQLDSGEMFKSYLPKGLSVADATRIGKAFMELAVNTRDKRS